MFFALEFREIIQKGEKDIIFMATQKKEIM